MDQDTPFLTAIALAPGDALPRLTFADWLGEQGRHNEELGQRWAAREGKYPLDGRLEEDGIGGWYPSMYSLVDGRFAKHSLPKVFEHAYMIQDKSSDEQDSRRTSRGITRPYGQDDKELIECERRFLLACEYVVWSPDGEPVGVAEPEKTPTLPAGHIALTQAALEVIFNAIPTPAAAGRGTTDWGV